MISRPTAEELKNLGIIDHVLPAPKLVNDVQGYAKVLGAYLEKTVKDLARRKLAALIRLRRSRAKSFGIYQEEAKKRVGLWSTFFRLTPLRRKTVPLPDLKTFSLGSSDLQPGIEWGEHNDPGISPEEYVKCGDMSLKSGDRPKGCGTVIPLSQFLANHYVCPNCGLSLTMGAMGWINCLADSDSFQEMNRELTAAQLLHPSLMTPEYQAFLARQDQRTNFHEALVTGEATIYGFPVALAICEFYFAGGSMGVAFGEKFYRLSEYARAKNLPVISLCCSGGARLLEGVPALTQMVKTVNCVTRLKRDGVPFVSVLGDPSTGGAIASYAALGDVIIAEPQALIIFTGPRVMEARGFPVREEDVRGEALCQNSRHVYENLDFYGDIRGVHEVAERKDLKRAIFKYLEFYRNCQPVSNRYWSPGRKVV
jgi:acetyl-CoA carboxylase carboxyl transferase beta subunit